MHRSGPLDSLVCIMRSALQAVMPSRTVACTRCASDQIANSKKLDRKRRRESVYTLNRRVPKVHISKDWLVCSRDQPVKNR